MAGKGNEDRGGAAVQAAWVEARLQDLRDMIDGAFAAVATWPVPQGDLTAADKKTRAITNLARAVAATQSAARRIRAATGGEGDSTEDEMNDGDRPDPETVERYKAELLDRLEHNHALLEAKRLAADARDGGGVETAPQG